MRTVYCGGSVKGEDRKQKPRNSVIASATHFNTTALESLQFTILSCIVKDRSLQLSDARVS